MFEDLNLSFETGDFQDFETIGVASIETADFGVTPTDGEFQALITTGDGASVSTSELETFLGLDAGDIESLDNGVPTEGSAIQLAPITIEAGQVLSFNWNFLTDEGTPSFFNDFAFVSIASPTELADTNSTFVLSASPFSEETGYQSFFFESPIDTTLTVGLGVVDVSDTVVDSGLLIDNFQIITPIEGTAGDDTLEGTAEDDIIRGLAGNDVLQGFAGIDFLEGGTGNDSLQGGEDNDSLEGGTGNDVLQGETGNDSLLGGAGNDTIGGADGSDSLFGNGGNDILAGGDNQDTIEGNSGDDILSGGRGADSLLGGVGNDTLEGNPGNDTLRGNGGADTIFSGLGDDLVTGNGGSDRIFGGFGDDDLNGNGGSDTIRGGVGSDTLNGGAGNDLLQGGIGNDFLFGGAGADQFVLEIGQGGETISDFEDDFDQFVLGTGLSFDNLDILSTGSDTVIINNNTVLAVVENTPAFVIGVEDFVF